MEYKIALIKGDGIGPEITKEAVKVLNTIGDIYGHKFEFNEVIGAGEAVDKCGDPLPEESLQACLESDSVMIGNLGGKKWDKNPLEKKPVKAIFKIREALNVSTNIRPITLRKGLEELSPLKSRIIEKGMDVIVVRDIAGGMLCAQKESGVGMFGREASDLEYYNEEIIRKSALRALNLAKERRQIVSSIDKSNVLASSMLWKEIVNETSKHYPDIKIKHHLVDNAAMEVILEPYKFDVIVTSNMFGDILADELSQITGTASMLPSAEVDCNGKGLYTPNQLHHPDESIIGLDRANPIGMITSAALMLRYSFGLVEEAEAIENAVDSVIECGYATEDIYTEGKILVGTEAMGNLIAKYLNKLSNDSYKLYNKKVI
ncbi:3-isopropylmalate dehydrogenase [Romboutsia weinsteinii]|uniref:3-isopropylmalate dehydrogenase n=1 Tax=Romboutsia weinsteinii TaxID=2020949 RepID=A0A371IZY3_9FIRM|nr:3-isopropylmalate dehydrogenase [Romboutsia weinsteinii]RDY26004.1 3-isopropylmalate dehydrogenase [Romboutsia weinsteinii]